MKNYSQYYQFSIKNREYLQQRILLEKKEVYISKDYGWAEVDNWSDLNSDTISLHCQRSKLDQLPGLPDNLVNLFCHGNQLTFLSDLPQSLKELQISHNQLTSLFGFK